MKRVPGAGLFLAFVCVSAVRAEVLPTFGAGLVNYATHVVRVKTLAPDEGKFRVIESWKGSLKKDDLLKIPALVREARGEMVLFLRRTHTWQPAGSEGEGEDWRTSAVWLDGDKVTAIQQPHNPGPAYVTTIPDIGLGKDLTRKTLKEEVLFIVESQRAFDAARAIRDLDRRVKALGAIARGHSRRQSAAIVELGKCGPKAIPVLRKLLAQPADHLQADAVASLVEVGGETVVPELNKMLDAELDYWKKSGPKLERGWMLRSDTEPSKRFTKLWAIVAVYWKYPVPALRKKIVAARDFFRTIPVLDAEPGCGSFSKYCDEVLVVRPGRNEK